MRAKKFNTYEELDGKDGSYVILKDKPHPSIFIVLPCGHNFNPPLEGGKAWEMKDIEDETKITLSPSIFCSPQVPCWHGFLTNGEFKTC